MSRSSRTLYVGNLPGDIREREVEDLFYKVVHLDHSFLLQHSQAITSSGACDSLCSVDETSSQEYEAIYQPETGLLKALAIFEVAETGAIAINHSWVVANQGYSSAEDEEHEPTYLTSDEEDDEDLDRRNDHVSGDRNNFKKPLFDPPNPSASSSLPSALDAFSEISRPPEFLNNSVGESASAGKENDGQLWRHGRRRNRRDKNDIPEGAVVEAKAQLVGIRERVSSDAPNAPSTDSAGSAKRVMTATNPRVEDAADLLRMCVQCGIPKTFSNARGMVCPVCGDLPIKETDESAKKKGSMIKDKEKNKRMKGQSAHATWKSETEMQLRQQFD